MFLQVSWGPGGEVPILGYHPYDRPDVILVGRLSHDIAAVLGRQGKYGALWTSLDFKENVTLPIKLDGMI
jgi:hypothetical protein